MTMNTKLHTANARYAEVLELRQQRDELLAALQAVFRQTVTLRLAPDSACRELMRAAIAKAQVQS